MIKGRDEEYTPIYECERLIINFLMSVVGGRRPWRLPLSAAVELAAAAVGGCRAVGFCWWLSLLVVLSDVELLAFLARLCRRLSSCWAFWELFELFQLCFR
jgi:hypothetical protein